MMRSDGYFDENTLHITWDPVIKGVSYSVIIEKCGDENEDYICNQIFSRLVRNTTNLIETSDSFSDCTAYLLKVIRQNSINLEIFTKSKHNVTFITC